MKKTRMLSSHTSAKLSQPLLSAFVSSPNQYKLHKDPFLTLQCHKSLKLLPVSLSHQCLPSLKKSAKTVTAKHANPKTSTPKIKEFLNFTRIKSTKNAYKVPRTPYFTSKQQDLIITGKECISVRKNNSELHLEDLSFGS